MVRTHGTEHRNLRERDLVGIPAAVGEHAALQRPRADSARCPGSPVSGAPRRGGRGIAPSRPAVYGCRGAAKSSPPAPPRPAAGVHHDGAVAMSATTPRSCVTSTIAVPGSSRTSRIRSRIRLDRHVERRRRLVGDEQLRVARERHRDHHPLAHPAGELVRILVDASRGRPGCGRAPSSSIARAACRPALTPWCRPQHVASGADA